MTLQDEKAYSLHIKVFRVGVIGPPDAFFSMVGRLDNIKIWNRLLTSDERTTEWNTGCP